MLLDSYRKKKGYTFKELSVYLEVEYTYCYRICKKQRIPSFEVARKIVKKTKGKVTYDDFWKHTES